MDYQVLEHLFQEIALLVCDNLSQAQKEDFREFSSAHEWGIALECLCDWLYEDEIEISPQAYQAIKKAGKSIELDESEWLDLENQVNTSKASL